MIRSIDTTVAVVLLTWLTGCTTLLVHPTKGKAEFDDDALDCETRAAPIRDPIVANSFIGRCMATKGWRRK
jgi:hypothetical protein